MGQGPDIMGGQSKGVHGILKDSDDALNIPKRLYLQDYKR
jgi:hypothetical protein